MDTAHFRILSEYQVKKLRMAFLDKHIHKIGYVYETGKIIIEYSGGSGPNDWTGVMNTMAIPTKEEYEKPVPGWQYGDENTYQDRKTG